MNIIKQLGFSLLWIIIGIILIICNLTDTLDAFWGGLGGGFLMVGLLQMIRQIRFRFSDSYREKIETEQNDERNRHLIATAWASAACSYLFIAAIALIVFKIIGHDELIMGISLSIGLLVLLFIVMYIYLKKKY